VPRDFDIFSPSAVKKPWTNTLVGARYGGPANSSIAGQNSVWK
jgi:hypothetical protein